MPKTHEIDYLLKRIPRELWEAAQRKAANQRPPISMRWVILKFLEDWTEKKPTGEKRPVKAGKAAPPPKPEPPKATPRSAPDLGSAF